MKKKIAAGITYYYPSKECLNRLNEYLDVFDMVFIYDNSERAQEYESILENKNCVYYITKHQNDGLPKAFNTIIAKCVGKIDYLCMLDQDSDFKNNEIKKMIGFIEENDSDKIGIIAPHTIYAHEKIKKKVNVEHFLYNKVNWVIASGSFIRIKSVTSMHIYFDDAYFIDRFDVDFCKQLCNNHLKIIVYNRSVLVQKLGQLGKRHHPQHVPLRHYYIFRNRLYYNHKFYPMGISGIISLLQSLRHIFYIVVYEDDFMEKIKCCFQGAIDYFGGNMGCEK